MPPRFGEVIKQARQARRLTLRRLAEQVLKEDATPISPQYLFDIEVHHRVPASHVLRELARVLELDYDTLLALAGDADVVVREYLQRYPEAEAAVIRLFRAAQQRGFHDWDQLCQHIDAGNTRGSSHVRQF
jgi:transcriptional regulator with XRE-family HTH domain